MVKLWKKYKYALITAILAFVGGLYYYFDPSTYIIMPKCPVKLLTTFDCPGCGFQRALHAFLHGNIKEAISYNLFFLVAIPIVFLWCFNGILIEKTSNSQRRIALINVNRYLVFFYIACYLFWFVIRNVFCF